MIQSIFDNIHILGVSAAVPTKKSVLLDDYSCIFGEENVLKFSKTTGVLERRIASTDQTASDLSFVAAKRLLENKNISKNDIGICVFVTQTPDYRIPSTACVLHKRLELPKDCIAFDINLGCSGYVYGLQVVSSLLQSSNASKALLLVGDTITKTIAPKDSSAVMLFGDAGSATLLEKRNGVGAIHTAYRTDGTGFKSIIIPAGAYRNRESINRRVIWSDGNERSDYELYMNGVDVFSFTISEVPSLFNEFFEINGYQKQEYDCFAFHQANQYILRQLVKLTKIEKDKMHISMDRYGNTSVTSIPLTICDKYGDDNSREKKRVLSCGFGIGLSWGIASFQINTDSILPIIETDECYSEGGVSHE